MSFLASIGPWSSWLEDLRRWLERGREEKARRAALRSIMKALVQEANPLIWDVDNCQEILRPALEHALEYLDQALGDIPGPITVHPKTWSRDLAVSALFNDQEALDRLLAAKPGPASAFADPEAQEAFGLLLMTMHERTIFTNQTQGEMIKRDVARGSVSFNDHRLVGLSPSQEETMRELKMRGLFFLASQVQARIHEEHTQDQELHQLHNSARVKLHALEGQLKEIGPHDPQHHELVSQRNKLRLQVEELDASLHRVEHELSSGEVDLKRLRDYLAGPQDLLSSQAVHLTLSQINLVCGPDDREACRQVSLARISMNQDQWMATLVRFERPDFQD